MVCLENDTIKEMQMKEGELINQPSFLTKTRLTNKDFLLSHLERNFLSKLTLEERIFLFAFCFGKNLKSYKTEDRFSLHEATKLAILVFLTKKTSNDQRKKEQKTTKLGEYCLTNKEN